MTISAPLLNGLIQDAIDALHPDVADDMVETFERSLLRKKFAARLAASSAAVTQGERASDAKVRSGNFPYQQTFEAIAAAVTWLPEKAFSISVVKFQEAFNSHRDARSTPPVVAPDRAAVIEEPAWPAACHDPDSCSRHQKCMYLRCPWEGKDIKNNIAQARALVDAKGDGK
jgi:hypothetical protein